MLNEHEGLAATIEKAKGFLGARELILGALEELGTQELQPEQRDALEDLRAVLVEVDELVEAITDKVHALVDEDPAAVAFAEPGGDPPAGRELLPTTPQNDAAGVQ